MRALILVVSAEKKGVSSTTGMQTTVATSSLFATRAKEVVPRRMKEMEAAIQERDFEAFGKVTMRESNGFHATCLDTEPPIFYLNDVSRAAIRVVEVINEKVGAVVAAYTFDAGPNAVIYFLEESAGVVVGTFRRYLPRVRGWGAAYEGVNGFGLGEGNESLGEVLAGGVSRVILTGVGEGPVSVKEHLVDEEGKPVEERDS